MWIWFRRKCSIWIYTLNITLVILVFSFLHRYLLISNFSYFNCFVLFLCRFSSKSVLNAIFSAASFICLFQPVFVYLYTFFCYTNYCVHRFR